MKFFSKTPREPENAEAEPEPEVAAPATPVVEVEVDLETAIPVENDEPTEPEVEVAAGLEAEVAAESETEIEAEVEQLESVLEPPRPLAPGAFLGGDLEIIEVVARGQINLYRADVDEWGTHDYQLVAERNAPENFIENPPASELFPAARRWRQDGLEYAAWPLQQLTQLADWQPPANDEVYLQTLSAIAAGLTALEEAELRPELPRDALWVDAFGAVRFYGFFDAKGDKAPAMSALQQLSALSSRLAKSNLAHGATLKLDDEFSALPLSDETKTFAKRLAAGEFETIGEAADWLRIAPVHNSEIALLSDVGMERELNEDCGMTLRLSRAGHAQNTEVEVVAVADGMGGHEGGEVASQLALSTLQSELLNLDIDWSDNAAVMKTVGDLCETVNAAVVSMNENPPYAAMRNKPGATLVWALRLGSRVFIGNVGDSRAYRWSAQGGLERLTTDHSYVQDLIDSGRLNESEAWGHPDGSVITSHIGMARGMQRDVFLHLVRPGDKLFLVSDGVVDMLRDEAIEEIVAHQAEPRALCGALVEASNDAGGADNITVAALFCV